MTAVFNKGKLVLDKISAMKHNFCQWLHDRSEAVYILNIILLVIIVVGVFITIDAVETMRKVRTAKEFLISKNIILPLPDATVIALDYRIKKLESVGFETLLWKVRETPKGYFAICTLKKDNESYIFMEDSSQGITITPKASSVPMVFIQNGAIKAIKE